MNTRTLLVLLLAAAAGCVDNNASVRLSAVCAPPSDGSCAWGGTCGTVWMSNLWVDAGYSSTPATLLDGTLYWPFQADNQRPDNSVRDGGTNTATAFITGFNIDYSSSSMALPSVKNLLDTTRTIAPTGSTVLMIPVIPASVSSLLNPIAVGNILTEVRADIRALGHYGDGSTFETGPFSVVVEVINGAGSGVSCSDPTLTNVVSVCPKAGQSNVSFCK
jgi:hypothetical protein